MCDNCKKECNKEMKLPKITNIFLILTERCSLACKYCFVNQNPREMTLEVAKDALHFIVRNYISEMDNKNKPSINFFGGEPMLKYNEIIKPLIEYSKQIYGKGFVRFSMTSNGVHFNEEILDYLKENDVGILMSLDGCKESHDANRIFHNGKGSFDVIERNLDHYLSLYKTATLRCTLEKNNAHLMMNSVKFGIERGFNNIFFVPNTFTEWEDEYREILKQQIREFGDFFIENMRKNIHIKLNPFDRKINEIVKINNLDGKEVVHNGRGKCGLGISRFASVGTDGTLYGCQEMTSNSDKDGVFVIGDIYNGTNDGKRIKLLESFNEGIIVRDEKCSECKLKNICNGGCVANNYMQTGDMSKQADILCFWDRELLEEAIRVMTILGEEKNQLFKNTFFKKVGGKNGNTYSKLPKFI